MSAISVTNHLQHWEEARDGYIVLSVKQAWLVLDLESFRHLGNERCDIMNVVLRLLGPVIGAVVQDGL